jgi:hypothetical protein
MMKDHTMIEMRPTVQGLREMTPEQLKALQENVLADGCWETASGLGLWFEWGTLMVSPKDIEGKPMLLIGIEKDGYTHS